MTVSLHVSCFGILLKQHLLRHYAEVVAPSGKLHASVAEALQQVPADFSIAVHAEALPKLSSFAGGEQHVTLQLHLAPEVGAATSAGLGLRLQGVLARKRREQCAGLMLFGLRWLVNGGECVQPQKAVFLQALHHLATGHFTVDLQHELRVPWFASAVPSLNKEKSRVYANSSVGDDGRPSQELARVA